MSLFTLKNFSFAYPTAGSHSLENIDLTIEEGSFVLLCGASGSGKSTLLRQLKPALAPHGTVCGQIYFHDQPLSALDRCTQSRSIGFVLQDVESQLVTDKVWHELAFGPESLGWDTPTIRRRVAETAAFFGIDAWFERNTSELSGGQKQLLNLAAVMVMQPEVLILDEPTAQLDPLAAADFLSALQKINREFGTAVILAEQRLEEVLPLAQQVVVLENGRLLFQGSPAEVSRRLLEIGQPLAWALPAPTLIQWSADITAPLIFSVREGRCWLEGYAADHRIIPFTPPNPPLASSVVLDLKEVWFQYPQAENFVLQSFSLDLRQGEFLALLGANGSGKSTALAVIAGLLPAYRGQVTARGSVALLAQNPQSIFCKNTVLADLEEVFTPKGLDDAARRAIDEVITLCRLHGLLERHPYDLSGGEQQRLALAKVLLLQPNILLLDEPTKGLDIEFKGVFAAICHDLQKKGISIIMASHDLSFCAAHADRCALCFNGQIINTAPPHEFFSGNSFLTTTANRMCRQYLPLAITPQEVIASLGGHEPQIEPPLEPPAPASAPPLPPPEASNKAHLSRRTRFAVLLVLFLIPLTLYVHSHYLNGEQYYFCSFLILLECMLPFFLIFEGRRPQARELVLIAVFCALGVAGRALFFMLPQFKPVMALVIIAGLAFGGEGGFLVGALTMLVSNMFFGMGPWAPWQMFAMGIIGFLAGILFAKGRLSRRKLPLCLFGAFCAIFIYGGIMNPAAAIMSRQVLSLPVLLSYYATGLPMDCVQAIATAFFLWFLAEPMLEKLDRIKLKYGLLR